MLYVGRDSNMVFCCVLWSFRVRVLFGENRLCMNVGEGFGIMVVITCAMSMFLLVMGLCSM